MSYKRKKGHSRYENIYGDKILYKKDFYIDTNINEIRKRNNKIHDLLFKIESLIENKVSENTINKMQDITEDIYFLLIENNFQLNKFRMLPDES